jgi:hypothetical protein
VLACICRNKELLAPSSLAVDNSGQWRPPEEERQVALPVCSALRLSCDCEEDVIPEASAMIRSGREGEGWWAGGWGGAGDRGVKTRDSGRDQGTRVRACRSGHHSRHLPTFVCLVPLCLNMRTAACQLHGYMPMLSLAPGGSPQRSRSAPSRFRRDKHSQLSSIPRGILTDSITIRPRPIPSENVPSVNSRSNISTPYRMHSDAV